MTIVPVPVAFVATIATSSDPDAGVNRAVVTVSADAVVTPAGAEGSSASAAAARISARATSMVPADPLGAVAPTVTGLPDAGAAVVRNVPYAPVFAGSRTFWLNVVLAFGVYALTRRTGSPPRTRGCRTRRG